MVPAPAPELTGTITRRPFDGTSIGTATAPKFEELAAEFGAENVLVVKRFPTGLESIEHAYADAVGGVEQPTVVGLSAHASRSLTELPAPPTLLDQGERNLLLKTFLRDHDWADPYLASASKHESFVSDVGRFIAEATWQGGAIETDDPSLAELAEMNTAFHEWLESADRLDPSRSLRVAADTLRDTESRAVIQAEFDVVLVLEFEEFTAIDREYLARLTQGVPLHCVAEADSAIQRTWNEPRSITDHVTSLYEVESPETHVQSGSTAPATVASYLATGESDTELGETAGSVSVIEAETFSDEIAAIAEEIERLHRIEGLAYDDMAVVLRDSKAPIPETLRGLRAAGVPVTSATVGGLEHDPAARELYALASWCVRADARDPEVEPEPAAAADGEATDGELPGWGRRRARSVLEARVGSGGSDFDELLATVRDRAASHSLADGINYWLLATDLKHRIATEEDPLNAKTQFGHVRTLRRLIRAVDESDLLDSTWRTLSTGLEEELQRTTTDKIATELALPEGGVLVDAVRVVKNEQRPVVFMPDVIDREYPAAPRFTSLFPTPHLEQLEGYPSFTTPTPEDVAATFAPSDTPTRPLHAYYAALSRRMLAVGARCAGDRLYFSVHRDDATGTGGRQQPSRFLAELENEFGAFDRVEPDGLYSHGEAVRFALTRVDDALDRVRQAGVVTGPIDLAEMDVEFEAVQRILADNASADLAPALEARLDFADGGVRRD